MKRRDLVLAAIALPSLMPSARAHHGWSSFDQDRPLYLEGKVVKMDFVNPHSWLYIDAVMPDGKVERWGIEGGSPNVMFRLGWTRDTLQPGTRIKVSGSPAKDGAKRMNSRGIEFPDGKKLELGGTKQEGK